MNIRNLNCAYKYAQAFMNSVREPFSDKDLYAAYAAMNFFIYKPAVLSVVRDSLIQVCLDRFGLSSAWHDLIRLLIKHGRLMMFPDILRCFCWIYQTRSQVMVFDVMSAYSISNEDLKDIQQFLTVKTGKRILFQRLIDKQIIAGLRLRSSSLSWEYSIQRQLRAVKYGN